MKTNENCVDVGREAKQFWGEMFDEGYASVEEYRKKSEECKQNGDMEQAEYWSGFAANHEQRLLEMAESNISMNNSN